MKIKTDFVTNSSSTSFVIVGISMENVASAKIINEMGEKYFATLTGEDRWECDDWEEHSDEDLYQAMENMVLHFFKDENGKHDSDTVLEYRGTDWSGYLGLDAISEYTSGNNYEQSIQKLIRIVKEKTGFDIPEEEIDLHEECYYD